jgi:hypothetical protein
MKGYKEVSLHLRKCEALSADAKADQPGDCCIHSVFHIHIANLERCMLSICNRWSL